MAKPVLQDSYDPISKSELEAFEDKLGIDLPADYRSFLLEHNGGDYPATVSTPYGLDNPKSAFIGVFYGLNAQDDFDLLDAYEVLCEQLPLGILPIGDDDGGNEICLVVTEQDYGSIWFWHHELSQNTGWPPLNSDRLADSFAELYGSLQYYLPFCEEVWQETSPAFMAAERGDANALSSILDDGFDIESRNNRGQTLLACAARARQSQIVRMLLERGANVHAKDSTGKTPLHEASSSHSLDSAKLLVSFGAVVNALDAVSNTPLLCAMSVGYRLPLFLISCGADVNIPNQHGVTALMRCKPYEQYLREPLIQAGAVQ